ncbi:MAG: periplasmic heavy metal sensor [Candidatus Acidiferrales bacterium]
MRMCSKAALAVLALALSSAPLLAQGDSQNPPPPQQQGPLGGFGSRGPMGDMRGMGPDGDRGGWGGGMRGGFDRGGRMGRGFGRGGRMGMRGGFGDGQREFGLTRALRDPAIRQQVGITDDQFAKIRQQESDFRKTEIRDRADLQVKRIDLKDLLSADKPDRAAIDSKLQDISASQLALEKAGVDFRLDMRDAITPAQRDKLRQAMKDRWQDRSGGPGRPRGPQAMGHRGQGQRQRGSSGAAPTPQPNAQPAPPPNN